MSHLENDAFSNAIFCQNRTELNKVKLSHLDSYLKHLIIRKEKKNDWKIIPHFKDVFFSNSTDFPHLNSEKESILTGKQ